MKQAKLRREKDWNKRFIHNGCEYMVNFDFTAEGLEVVDVDIQQIFNLTSYEDCTDPVVRLLAVQAAKLAADDVLNNFYQL